MSKSRFLLIAAVVLSVVGTVLAYKPLRSTAELREVSTWWGNDSDSIDTVAIDYASCLDENGDTV